MAFLGIKSNKKEKAKSVKTKKLAVTPDRPASAAIPKQISAGSVSDAVLAAIIRPRVTEKATLLAEGDRRVYTFEVSASATKGSVSKAITALYKVTPEKIRVVNVKPSRVFVRGKRGHTPGFKKAYVYLKRGEKISE